MDRTPESERECPSAQISPTQHCSFCDEFRLPTILDLFNRFDKIVPYPIPALTIGDLTGKYQYVTS